MSTPLNASKTERIHSLDSLRAIMMLLGLVIHSAITYGMIEGYHWPLKDPETTGPFMDYLVLFIHSFRMPIFLIMHTSSSPSLAKASGVRKNPPA